MPCHAGLRYARPYYAMLRVLQFRLALVPLAGMAPIYVDDAMGASPRPTSTET
jgi:hypothetical protein